MLLIPPLGDSPTLLGMADPLALGEIPCAVEKLTALGQNRWEESYGRLNRARRIKGDAMPHVTFIHGIGNKPEQDVLLDTWVADLADNGLDLPTRGVSTSMVCWADVMYPQPAAAELGHESAEAMAGEGVEDIDMTWLDDADESERRLVGGLATAILLQTPAVEELEEIPDPTPESTPEAAIPTGYERIPLPESVKRPLMKALLRDVHHYLFDTEHRPRKGVVYKVQKEIRQRFLTELQAAAGSSRPHVVVSHSMGTVIAYDCLKRVSDCPPVDGLVTIGSPLGFDEIIDRLRPEWTSAGGFPSERLGGGWTNVYDPLDIVAGFHPRLAGSFRRDGERVLKDVMVWNRGTWRHGIANYFARPKLRDALAELLWPGRGGSGR